MSRCKTRKSIFDNPFWKNNPKLEIKDIFDYKNGNLYWRLPINQRSKVGDKIGCLVENYYKMTLQGVTYQLHRVIYEFHFGRIPPGFEVDHKDNNPVNNNIDNLRLATRSQNVVNTRVKKNDTFLPRGLSKNQNKWQVYFKKRDKILFYRKYICLGEALKECLNKGKEIHGEFYNSKIKVGNH